MTLGDVPITLQLVVCVVLIIGNLLSKIEAAPQNRFGDGSGIGSMTTGIHAQVNYLTCDNNSL